METNRSKETYVETHSTTSNQGYEPSDLRRGFSSRVVSVQLRRSFVHYWTKGAALTGIVQVLLGILSIALGISQPLVFTTFGESAFGIWCGVIFVVAGLMGIISNKKNTPGWIVAHMVFSILAAVLAGLMFAMSVSAAVYDNRSYLGGERRSLTNLPTATRSAVVVDVLVALTAFFEAISAIIAASISCNVTCCNNNFHASQKEVDSPTILSYHVTDSKKYVVNPTTRY